MGVMGIWSWFFITVVLIALGVLLCFVIRFFRRLYFVIEEVDARLMQLRNLLELDRSEKKKSTSGENRK